MKLDNHQRRGSGYDPSGRLAHLAPLWPNENVLQLVRALGAGPLENILSTFRALISPR